MGDGIGNGKQSDGQNLLVRRLGVSGQYGFSLCSIDSCGKGGHYKFVFFWGGTEPREFPTRQELYHLCNVINPF
jgi:hypothetical protein